MTKYLLFCFCGLLLSCPSVVEECAVPDYSHTKIITIDDYQPYFEPLIWYYTRIGSDRGAMVDAGGEAQVLFQPGFVKVDVTEGWAGIWTSLLHNSSQNDSLDLAALLGPYIEAEYQPVVTGFEMLIRDGRGKLVIEFKNSAGKLLTSKEVELSGGSTNVYLPLEGLGEVKLCNYVLSGPGQLEVEAIRFRYEPPEVTLLERLFLYSYGHFAQCYAPESGLTRERARWPVEDYASVQTMGTFALCTALGHHLGFISESAARQIVQKTGSALLELPRFHGLLPHFLKAGQIIAGTEWSSIDTVISLLNQILACRIMGEDALPYEAFLTQIDWAALSDNGTSMLSMGFMDQGDLISHRWNWFGSEFFLLAVAYTAATGTIPVIDNSEFPTWDGSGFNNDMAALFFPMDITDYWGNDWQLFRAQATAAQLDYFTGHSYAELGLFGLSACEVPEPWRIPDNQIYRAWGTGGKNPTEDGADVTGYPILAFHYPVLTPPAFAPEMEAYYTQVMDEWALFTPLNNVESLGRDAEAKLYWNSLKGSWNLSLQTLGAALKICGSSYPVYAALRESDFLYNAYLQLQAGESN